MKVKGAKRRKIPESYIETLVALTQCNTTGEAAEKLYITYQGMHERIRRMNEWFGEVVTLKWRHHYLTETGKRLLEMWQLGYEDSEIIKELSIK